MKKLGSVFFAIMLLATYSCSQKAGMNGTDKGYAALDHPVVEISNYKHVDAKAYAKYEIATFAGGCFWCTEAAFERINGVVDVISGYSGGKEQFPTYKEVCDRATGHAEAIQIYYDPAFIDYETLLDVFFVAHDPTTLNRQGPDKGPQYRSAIYYHSDSQKQTAENKITELDASDKFSNPIVTELTAYDEFWVAEGYHQNFYELNPNQGYVRAVSKPKVDKVVKTFPQLLKKQFKKT